MNSTGGAYVYIMTNRNHTVLYTGVTSDLIKRVGEHKEHSYKGFTDRYNADKLIYYAGFSIIEEAIEREKIIKGGSRKRKIDLINSLNPEWRDLFEDIRGM